MFLYSFRLQPKSFPMMMLPHDFQATPTKYISPTRQKYAMTQAVLNLNASNEDYKSKFLKQKTYSVLERMTSTGSTSSDKSSSSAPGGTKLSKSRSERITKVEKMNIWKRFKKPSGSNANLIESQHEILAALEDSG